MRPSQRIPRMLLLAAGLLTLFASGWTGLARIGWDLPVPASWVAFHGALMVAGFLGTLIGLERAVALGPRLGYAAPVLCASGSLLVLGGPDVEAGIVLLLLGGAGLVVLVGLLARRHLTAGALLQVVAALLLVGGNLVLLLREDAVLATPWWLGFLVLTVTAERLDLSRVRRSSDLADAAFAGGLVLVLGGVLGTLGDRGTGMALVGLGYLVLAIGLGIRDVARRTVRTPGLPRFMAAGLLAAYAWLGFAGLAWTRVVPLPEAYAWDAALHAVTLGFTFSMIFAHAPMIFPAVLGAELTFSRSLYLPLALLQASLLVRVAGDLTEDTGLRRVGAFVSGLAIFVFFPLVLRGGRSRPGSSGPSADGERMESLVGCP